MFVLLDRRMTIVNESFSNSGSRALGLWVHEPVCVSLFHLLRSSDVFDAQRLWGRRGVLRSEVG
jgi:hypothetical protein